MVVFIQNGAKYVPEPQPYRMQWREVPSVLIDTFSLNISGACPKLKTFSK